MVDSPPPSPPAIHERRATGPGSIPIVLLRQAQPLPQQLPQVDIAVEVVGNLPLQAKLENVTRLLGRRQAARSVYRSYPPTILELIMLVNRHPERPRFKTWNSVAALSIRYDEKTKQVRVEYCLDYCGHNRTTGAFDPRRKMVSYAAHEDLVVSKVDKKLADLKKFAER